MPIMTRKGGPLSLGRETGFTSTSADKDDRQTASRACQRATAKARICGVRSPYVVRVAAEIQKMMRLYSSPSSLSLLIDLNQYQAGRVTADGGFEHA